MYYLLILMSSLVSGVLNRESADTLTILENQESKFDDLELRQLNGDETLLMTENFEAVEKKSEVRGEKSQMVVTYGKKCNKLSRFELLTNLLDMVASCLDNDYDTNPQLTSVISRLAQVE